LLSRSEARNKAPKTDKNQQVNLVELLNIANYSPSAVEAASSTSLDQLTGEMSVVSASAALQAGDDAKVAEVLTHAVGTKPAGHTAFLISASAMTVAATSRNQELFTEALRLWIAERVLTPTHFDHAVLTELMASGEEAALLAKIPTTLRKAATSAPKIKVPKVTASQQKLIDLVTPRMSMIVRQAVSANTEFLPIRVNLEAYRLDGVNARIRELTLLSSDDSLPTLMVVLDKTGNFSKSYIAH
jgi:hypothetical protein